ncbi:DUF2889 domain-containing protein [Noviherbaspirillum sedimenti]|uniref:DUF2889 domain-containing protein n=1 Tax=Noviherbaspirillum sedimenti TaxID=2320865 RepID=UPI001314E23C|nr:DUF2889 domain-containing protein [Noviherbaspirillum sedimenti]
MSNQTEKEFVTLHLPDPVIERELLHTRSIIFKGYRRKDNLWDIEGHLTDVRANDVNFPGGHRRGGDPIHDMWMRLTVDAACVIREVQTSMDAVPYEGTCGNIQSRYACIVGMRVGSGFRGQIRQLLGGINGCTHMTELLLSMGTAIIQTLEGEIPFLQDEKPFALDGCHALDTSGRLVAEFHPRWYRPGSATSPAE